MITREQALAALASLNPAPVFLQAYHSKRLPENLDIYFGPPEEFFLAPDTQGTYTEGRLVPILDDGNFGIVTFLDPATKSLLKKDVEVPSEVVAQFQNWQQYLADLLIWIAETVEDDDAVRRIAGVLQFKYADETLAFLERVAHEPHDQYETSKSAFLSSLKA
jgi:hypothetical protein